MHLSSCLAAQPHHLANTTRTDPQTDLSIHHSSKTAAVLTCTHTHTELKLPQQLIAAALSLPAQHSRLKPLLHHISLLLLLLLLGVILPSVQIPP